MTPEGITLSGMESDTAFSSDDDDEEDCYSSASIASSSLSSPEIFREENYSVFAFVAYPQPEYKFILFKLLFFNLSSPQWKH